MKINLDFKLAKLDFKSQELYSKVLIDSIAPEYFAVIKEAKYCSGLENLTDKYKASIERQPYAMNSKDYSPSKAEEVNGLVRHFSDEKYAIKWLKDTITENFNYGLKVW